MKHLLACLLLLAAVPGHAQAPPDQILAGMGVMHLRQPPRFGYASVEAHWMRPDGWLGTWAAMDGTGRDHFIGIGPLVQAPLGRGFTFLGGTGPGVVSDHASTRLGYRFEFRSSASVCWTSDHGQMLMLSLSHYSNGGMSSSNPGVEGIRILYGIRFGRGTADQPCSGI